MHFSPGRISACEPAPSPGPKLTLVEQHLDGRGQTCRLGRRSKPRRHPAVAPDEEFGEIPSDAVTQKKAERSRSFPAQETVKGMGILSVHQ